jgi:hypothetical protein
MVGSFPETESYVRYPKMTPLSVEETLRLALMVAELSALRVIGIGFSTTFKFPYVINSKLMFGSVLVVLFIKTIFKMIS